MALAIRFWTTPPEQARIRVNHQLLGNVVDQLRAIGSRDGVQVVDEPLDEGPEIDLAALELDSRLGLKVRILFDHLAYERSEMLDVAAQAS